MIYRATATLVAGLLIAGVAAAQTAAPSGAKPETSCTTTGAATSGSGTGIAPRSTVSASRSASRWKRAWAADRAPPGVSRRPRGELTPPR